MNFFEIRKYSVRNFNLVQKNYISLPLIPVSLSQEHYPFLVCIISLKLRLTFNNSILKTKMYYLFEKIIAFNQKYIAFP